MLEKTFLEGQSKSFKHKSCKEFQMYPFTSSTSDIPLSVFDNILGSFLRAIYDLELPKELNRESIVEEIVKSVDTDDQGKKVLQQIIKDLYFKDESSLKCSDLDTYKYMLGSKNDQKIADYIVDALCYKDTVVEVLNELDNGNVFDELVKSHLPKLNKRKSNSSYLSLIPSIKDVFTNDLITLIKNNNTDTADIVRLLSYYYFFYTSQVLLNNNKFGKTDYEIMPVYFCTEWEKTSKTRDCFTKGWRQIESKLKTMFTHSVLLELLNQTDEEKKYTYYSLVEEYEASDSEEKNRVYNEIKHLRDLYRTQYVPQEGSFTYEEYNYNDHDIIGLIKGLFDDILLQFENTVRARANEAYKTSFHSFCKSNFLQNRKAGGLMLALSEEYIVLLTNAIIGNKKQVRLNTLFEEFNRRGIFMDNHTQESIVEFYEKLNIIEKKSDSGDAKYVKGIL